jgi:enterochelin esterase-like enzyme
VNAWWQGISLVGGPLPLVVDLTQLLLVLAVVTLVVIDRRPGTRYRLRRLIIVLGSAAFGGTIGLGLCWALSDQLNLFDVTLSPTSRSWVAMAFAGVAVAVAGIALTGVRGRVVAGVAIAASLLAGTVGVNADFGQYTTVGSLSDHAVAAPLPASVLARQAMGAPGNGSTTVAPVAPSGARGSARTSASKTAAVAASGLVGSVTIPGTVSHFRVRSAYVYLPPAALTPHPMPLPVIIMLSGQPGSPGNVISSGNIAAIFDAYALTHNGRAPIVVAADQLTAPQINPMCVDGTLGNSATYLTVDVPNWIRTHLTVETAPADWGIAGFSQGGTCSIQLGSQHPTLFGNIIDVSGQLAPKNGNMRQTIALGFHGDAAAYRAALPETVLRANAPYAGTVAVFGAGQLDLKYGPIAMAMSAAAQQAGIGATHVSSPGTAHDWHTVQWVLRNALAPIYQHMGLAQ